MPMQGSSLARAWRWSQLYRQAAKLTDAKAGQLLGQGLAVELVVQTG
jgi:hypothetical protein